jgi:two-component system, cell cycle sensor histidine kinase and response regulator CckA
MRFIAFWQPMRRRLPLLITILLVVAIGALAGLAHHHVAKALEESARVRVASVSAQLAANFAESERLLKSDKRRLAADSSFARFLASPDSESERLARHGLDQLRNNAAHGVAVELWDRKGRRLLSSEVADYRNLHLDSGAVRGLFDSQSLIGPVKARNDTIYTEVRVPIVVNGDTLAFVRQFDRVSDARGGMLVRSLIGSHAVLLVGNVKGDVWTDLEHRVPAPPGWRADGASHVATGSDGASWVGATAAVPRVPWVVWVALPREVVLAPARALLRQIAVLALVIVALGAVAAWLLSRHLTRPLDDVIDAVESIASGDYTRRLATGGQGEVGRLATAFNQMSIHIQSATHDLECQQLELELGNQELEEAVDRADRTAAELRAIVEGSPLGICTLDADGIILSWNPAAERMFGWTAAEVVNRFNPAVSATQLADFAEQRRRLIEGEPLNGLLTDRLRKDGSTIPVSLSGAPLRDAEGTLQGLLMIVEDVTDKHHMQAQLATERGFLRQIIDLNPSFLFTKDRDGRYTMVNQAFADANGMSPVTMIGKTEGALTSNPAELESIRQTDRQVLRSGETVVVPEMRVTDASGRVRWLHSVKRPIVGADGVIHQLLGVSTDITERKQLEAQLIQSQKMEAVGQLAGGVAHDFNNVLTAIKGFSELAALELEDGHPASSDVREITVAADRAASLTKQLLAFSRRQLLQPTVVSPNEVIEGVSKMLLRLIGAEVRCETKLASDVASVLADAGQLEQVLMNLAVNARDAMPTGGTLTIETANVVLGEEHASRFTGTEVFCPGEYVIIAVSDSGVGMSRAVQARVFEPFYTTKDPGAGTGLGLSTVYGIVKQSGGYINFTSEVGCGTTFRVYLPQVEAEAVPIRQSKMRDSAPQPTSETILVVDDDVSVRVAIARILSRAGYSVLTASGPSEAEAVWSKHAGPIHLLMTDVMMPDMDGGELARHLLPSRPEARVLYTSGYTNETVIGRGAITSEMIFLAKPFTIDGVVQKVREALVA